MLRVAAVVEQCWHRVPGGTAVAAARTLDALAARGDVDLVGIAARHRDPPADGLGPSIPIRHSRLPRRALYDSWHRLGSPGVERLVGRVDVVHATGGAVPPAGRARLVATINDLAFLRRPEWFTRRGVRFATRGFELARARAEVVIAPSQTTAADLAGNGVEPERIRVAPLAVAAAAPDAAAIDAVRVRHRLPEVFALWVGTAEPRKNLAGLLRAAARTATGVPLVLAGPDGWGLDAQKLVAEAACDVMRLGFVPQRELPALYAAARVFVYPSLMEGFGLPVLEAMAQGTPVVTSSGTATEEVCGDPASVVDPTDVEALAAAIDAVVDDDAEHHRRSVAARRRASQFSWEATASHVRAAYEGACS